MKPALLKAEAISFQYGSRPLLANLDFSIHAGEFIGLVGKNGTGKTTLLHLLLGFLKPTSGKVLLSGKNIESFSRREIARQIALVPQEVRIEFSFSVRDIVAMGRNPHLGRLQPEQPNDTEKIQTALERTETSHLAQRSMSTLSGGERQRVLIARAIAQSTSLLLLDEPTADLDLSHQLDLLKLIQTLVKQGIGVVAAIHDLEMASRFCDRICILGNQNIVANGTPREVLTQENLEDYFDVKTLIGEAPDQKGLTIIPIESKT